MDQEVVRFAPAPSGTIHLGNARTALFNWLIARKTNGTFILRIDDTAHNATPEIVNSILNDLKWLGITPDKGPFFQSSRIERYKEALEKLLEMGAAYHCYCETKPKGRCSKCRNNKQNEIEQGHPIRLKMEKVHFPVTDLVWGWVEFKTDDDPVLWRSNGLPTYHLTSPIDDIDYGITLILRGEDLLPSTPYQLFLMQSLGATPPRYAHLSLVFQPDGGKISKRVGGFTLKELRDQGIIPESVVNVLALSGWSPPEDNDRFTMNELINAFSLDRISKSQSKFDELKLDSFHIYHIRKLTTGDLRERLKPFIEEKGIKLEDNKIELIVNLAQHEGWKLTEAAEQLEFLNTKDWQRQFTKQECEILKLWLEEIKNRSDNDSWDDLKKVTGNISQKLDVKVKEVFHTFRLAITGKDQGIAIAIILKLLGINEVVARLQTNISKNV